MSKPRIALVTGVYPPRIGGPAMQTRHLALLMKERGFEPVVITFGPQPGCTAPEGFKVYVLAQSNGSRLGKAWQYLRALFALRRILTREAPVAVHAQTVDPLALAAALASRWMHIPSLVKYAGDMVFERTMQHAAPDRLEPYDRVFTRSHAARFLRMFEKVTLHSFTRVWATSGFQAASLRRHLGIPESRIVRQPNYILLDAYTEPRERRDSQQPVILAAGRFAPWKRMDVVVRAFARLEHPGAVLWIAGGENDAVARDLERLAAQLGVAERVRFPGPVAPASVGELFRAADLFVSATEYEPFGIVFVEAMAAGLPVVATATGGVPEIVPDGRAGFLVAPGDHETLAQRLQFLLDHPEVRERMSRAGRVEARRYDLRLHADIVMDMLSAVGQPFRAAAALPRGAPGVSPAAGLKA